MVGVTGSIPVLPTTKSKTYTSPAASRVFCVSKVSANREAFMAIPSWRFRLIDFLPITRRMKFRRKSRLVAAEYDRQILDAQARRDPDEIAGLESQAVFELSEYEDAEAGLVTFKLRRRASILGVAVPRHHYEWQKGVDPEYWYRSQWSGEFLLTGKGVRLLRKRIRAELKARAELRALYLPWLSAVTGLLGTVVAIIALISGKR